MGKSGYKMARDREVEAMVAHALGLRWDCEFEPLPLGRELDWVCTRDKDRVAYADVACWVQDDDTTYSRDVLARTHGYTLSRWAWDEARHLCDGEGKPPLLLVVLTREGVWMRRFAHGEFKPEWREGDDLQFDLHKFRKIGGVEIRRLVDAAQACEAARGEAIGSGEVPTP